MRIRFPALIASLVPAAAMTAQGLPDMLLPTGTVASAVRRLVDRDQDGRYDTYSETFDFYRSASTVAYRDILESPWQPGSYYILNGDYGTTTHPRLELFRDANNDGLIDATEITVALDIPAYIGTNDPQTDNMATDGIAIYWISNAGVNEGVHRSIDLNGDGDFMDAGETTPALLEGGAPLDPANGNNAHPLGNVPLTIAASPTEAVFNPNDIQRIIWEPTVSQGSLALGRFLLEDENLDTIIAIEDKNGDGDFYDIDPTTGPEVYLFVGTNPLNSSANRIYRDVHPDVNVVFAECFECSAVYDLSTTPMTYYLMNRDGSTRPNAHNRIHRAQDLNGDGDINDAGEVQEFFNGSSALANYAFEKFFYQTVLNGKLYVTGHLLVGAEIHDALVEIFDANGDGTIDNADPLEIRTVWELDARREPLMPHFFPVGTFAAPPLYPPSAVRYHGAAGCGTTVATTHTLQVGGLATFDDQPTLGNTVLLWSRGVKPSSSMAMHVGSEIPGGIPLPGAAGCDLAVNVLFTATLGASNASGENILNVPVPLDPFWLGVDLSFQTFALDVGANPWNVTMSNGANLRFSDYSFTVLPDAP